MTLSRLVPVPDTDRGRVVRRAFQLVGAFVAVANVSGALLVFVYLAVVSPVPASVDAARRWDIALTNSAVFFPYITALTLLGVLVTRARVVRKLTWLEADRSPTPDEVDVVLRLPRTVLVLPGVGWLGAAALFGVIQWQFDVSFVLVMRVVTGILLGGVTTCTLVYLLVERAIRPVAALVLAAGPPERPSSPGILQRLLISWLFGAALPLLGVGLTQTFRTPVERQHLAVAIWFLVLVGVTTGSIAIATAAKSISDPIRSLREGVSAVRDGRLDVRVDVDDASEVGHLQAGFNEMVAGLAERRALQDLFGRHVGEDVARQALERGVALGGEQRQVAVLFVDVVGSTSLAEQRPAAEVVRVLNAFFDVVVAAVRAEGGWVDKFAGDGALCVFGAPSDHDDPVTAAMRAARAICRGVGELGEVDAGVGVSCGNVIAGNVGAAERFEYTVIGDPVNEASRLTDLAKEVVERVLASERAVAAAAPDEARHWRPCGETVLRGRSLPTRLFVPVSARAHPRDT